MKNNLQHNETNFLKGAEVTFKKSKEDIWEKLSGNIDFDNPPKKQSKLISLNWFKMASAAVLLIICGSAFFMKNYSILISSGLNDKFSYTLPDNSKVFLNENSTLIYHPYWWSFNREIEFEGEAFFEVEKGEKFTVISESGNTSVLGTSFNINSRTNYTVYCKTGKVAVNNTDEQIPIILLPNQLVIFKDDLKLKQEVVDENTVLNWRKTYLNFESVSVIEVFSTLENIYNVNLNYKPSEFLDLNYTSNYEKPSNIEDVLNMLSLSFSFTYSVDSTNYTLVKTK
jgi:ferric-dicitrate binding protein FerR (iron transport regulator)